MNRNTELHFKNTPQINLKRSKFDMSHSMNTTLNVGEIVPIFLEQDVLPGDTIQIDMSSIVRMATPIYPTFDNLYMDTYFFFVPNRLLWDNWAKFWGENDDPWIQQTEYTVPQITAPQGGWTEGTIADYLGVPTKISGLSISALPFRAYAKIISDWFRDENLSYICNYSKGDATVAGSNGGNYVTDCALGGKPALAAKMHDYFTSALPAPQKGPSVNVPLGGTVPLSGSITIPAQTVTAASQSMWVGNGTKPSGTQAWTPEFNNMGSSAAKYTLFANQAAGTGGATLQRATSAGSINGEAATIQNAYVNKPAQNITIPQHTGTSTGTIDLSQATAATINQLRTAFAIQKYYENAGLHGTRYIEYLRGVFGVTSSDARLQRAEYLGGKRTPIGMDAVVQTSSTDSTSPQGNVGAFSCTIDKNSMFTKSFEEHGIVMGLAVIRCEHTYQQGLARGWSRKKWTDYYNPFFAHLGEQAILNKEIYAQGNAQDDQAFGYQEAWADYRYKPSYVTGYMRSNASGTLDAWHYADKYTSKPTLSHDWIVEPKTNIDRTIAVTSQLMHQFIGNWYFKAIYTRPMPVYSVPGLIDHV